MYVTHDQVEAMTMGHRIAVMSEGRAAADRDAAGRLPPTGERLRRDVPRRPADEPDRRRARSRRRRRLALPRRERRRAALDGGAQRSRAGARDRGEAARSSSACGRSTSGSARPAQVGGIAGRRALPRAGRLRPLPHRRGRRHDRAGAHRPGLAACSRTRTSRSSSTPRVCTCSARTATTSAATHLPSSPRPR